MRPSIARLLESINAHARVMYEFGRADRVAGRGMDSRYVDDMYYHAAYCSERGREIVP